MPNPDLLRSDLPCQVNTNLHQPSRWCRPVFTTTLQGCTPCQRTNDCNKDVTCNKLDPQAGMGKNLFQRTFSCLSICLVLFVKSFSRVLNSIARDLLCLCLTLLLPACSTESCQVAHLNSRSFFVLEVKYHLVEEPRGARKQTLVKMLPLSQVFYFHPA